MCALVSEKLPVGLTRLGRPVNRASAINVHISVTPSRHPMSYLFIQLVMHRILKDRITTPPADQDNELYRTESLLSHTSY